MMTSTYNPFEDEKVDPFGGGHWQRSAARPESAEEPKYKFASTQVNLSGPVADRFREIAASIAEEDIGEDGREDEPHITVLYGLHDDDAEGVVQQLAGEEPIRVRFGKTSLFENDDADVLKVDIESEDLHRINGKLAELPHTNDHGEYIPHATLAYLKPGTGKRYAGKALRGVTGQEVTIDEVVLSGRDKNRTSIPLGVRYEEEA